MTKVLPTWAQIAGLSAQHVQAVAQSNTIRETNGNNRSPAIDRIERVYGTLGVSYCVEGGLFEKLVAVCEFVWPGVAIDDALLQKAKTLFEQNYGPVLTGCADMIAAYGKRKRWRPILGAQTMKWIGQLRAGDGIIYDFSTPGNVDRHYETFLKMQTNPDGSLFKNDDGFFVLVTGGFNTVPDAQSGNLGTGDQGNGQGCYIRHRPINHTIMGSIDFNTQKP